MRRFPTTLIIVIGTLVTIIGGWVIFAPSEKARYQAVQQVRHQRSEFHVRYVIERTKGPIWREEWKLDNIEGKGTATYAVSDRNGTTAHFAEPSRDYNVTFAFQELVADGVWDLPSRAGGDTTTMYTVQIAQTADGKSGKHTFTFFDPHYLATTAGRQYHITLNRNEPVPKLIDLQSTSTADPRYQKIVDDFGSFGSPSFKHTIAAARARVGGRGS